MNLTSSGETELQLAIDILADMVVRFLKEQTVPQIKEMVTKLMEHEEDELLQWELTAELLGTTEFRMVS